MDYAIQLLLPVIGGLMLGMWLNKSYGLPPIWTVAFAVLGMVGGIGILYRRYGTSTPPVDPKTINIHSAQRKAARIAQTGKTAHIKELDFLYQEHHADKDDWNELDDLDRDEDFPSKPAPSSKPKDDPKHHGL